MFSTFYGAGAISGESVLYFNDFYSLRMNRIVHLSEFAWTKLALQSKISLIQYSINPMLSQQQALFTCTDAGQPKMMQCDGIGLWLHVQEGRSPPFFRAEDPDQPEPYLSYRTYHVWWYVNASD